MPHFRIEFSPSAGEEIQSEYFVARPDAVDAIRALLAVGDELRDVLLVPATRGVAADSLWLSPQYEQDTIGFHFTWRQDQPAVERALVAVESALAPFSPRPHWGKLFLTPGTYARMADFAALRSRLDPRDAFRNPWLHRAGGGGPEPMHCASIAVRAPPSAEPAAPPTSGRARDREAGSSEGAPEPDPRAVHANVMRECGPPPLGCAEMTSPGSAAARERGGAAEQIRVGVIDSDSGFVRTLGNRLQAAGWVHRVLASPVPFDALAAMRLNAVVIDLAVLGPHGWGYLERLCAQLPDVGVVVCTGPSSVVQRVRGLRLRADDRVSKPSPPGALIARR